MITTDKNAAAAGTATALRILTLAEATMQDSTSPEESGSLLDAITDVIGLAEKCTTPGCDRPRVGNDVNDVLSVFGLRSTHCQPCTTKLLHNVHEAAA